MRLFLIIRREIWNLVPMSYNKQIVYCIWTNEQDKAKKLNICNAMMLFYMNPSLSFVANLMFFTFVKFSL